jgi:hypothetical protein
MDENISSMSYNLLDVLDKLLKSKGKTYVASSLNITASTIKRWIELKNIPPSYTFDLLKLTGMDIDYSKYSYKEKDQFFTPLSTAEYCVKRMKDIISKYGDDETSYTYIEPSAGNGTFLYLLDESRRIGMDIEPRGNNIMKKDFLDWVPSTSDKYTVIGNPPFGLRGQKALQFINHSSNFAEYVCFILPQLFESDGKGVPRKRVVGLNLIHSEKLNSKFIFPDGVKTDVRCIFQIWSKNHHNKKYDLTSTKNSNIKVYSLSDGGTSSTTRNKKMFNKCDIYLPSTCFGKDVMTYYTRFEDLPLKRGYGIVFKINKEENIKKFKEIIWGDIAFMSTNSAYNIRSSQIIKQFNQMK